jgi:DNA invertase Pin-like site-specific DNA recombinase
MEVVQVYSDHGRSGLNIAGREGLNQLMSDVGNKQANFSALLVYDVSRWGWFQDVDESAYYEYALKRAGIRVHYSSRADVADTEPNVEATWGGSVVWLKARDQLAHLAIGQSEG